MSQSSNSLLLTIVRLIVNVDLLRSYVSTPLYVSSYRLFSLMKSNILLPLPYLIPSATLFPPYIVLCRLKSPTMKTSNSTLQSPSPIIASQTSCNRVYNSYVLTSCLLPIYGMYIDTSNMLRILCFMTIAVMSLLFIVSYVYSLFRLIYMYDRILYIQFSLYSVFSFITLKLGPAPVI